MREEEVEEPPRHKEEPVPPGHKGERRKEEVEEEKNACNTQGRAFFSLGHGLFLLSLSLLLLCVPM